MGSANETCGVYRMKPSGTLENIADHSVIVPDEVKDDIDGMVKKYLKTVTPKPTQYLYVSRKLDKK